MRDPNRIDDFLKELGKIWKERVPNWRFGQLISNLQSSMKRDIFFMEEDEFLKVVKEYLNII